MRTEWIDNISGSEFGGKAEGLKLLKDNGFNVPDCFCIGIAESVHDFDDGDFHTKLEECLSILGSDLAVRSSSSIEDSFIDSRAGHFLTKTGTFDYHSLLDAIKQVYLSGPQMGVVIQQLIRADSSGVIFTSNPITYSKKTGLISCVSGMGEKLVSGKGKSIDYEIKYEDGVPVDLPDPLLFRIAHDTKSFERILGYPIDVEWAFKDGTVYYLQCRPITSITSVKTGIYSMKELETLPSQLRNHDKIKLRLEADKAETFISDAYISVRNTASIEQTLSVNTIRRSRLCKGYSCVVIYPERVSDSVVRSFVGSERDLSQSIGKCYRYGVRSYPEHKDLNECLDSFHAMVSDDYWVTAVIIQELFDAVYTGVLQNTGNEMIIEITKGHFLTKGKVLTSQYVVRNGEIVSRHEVHQSVWYRIIQGHVIECLCTDEKNSFVRLQPNEIVDIIESFKKILVSGGRVIEFGMVRYGNELVPYLIDFVDSNDNIHVDNLDFGIISSGFRKGRIKNIRSDEDSFNRHFHDKRQKKGVESQDLIFVCERPDIGLLDLLDQYDNSRIGFVFSDGSLLCHLAVVLRERGIPAIKVGEMMFRDGEEYILDAESAGLIGAERLIHA